ncbi:MAG: ATP-binding cassette domain-containing protein, partial [Blautia sp.]
MEIRHLCFAYDKTPIIKDLNFTIEEGKITTILGPNGCGKTTLFRLLTRNLFPAKGNVYSRNRIFFGLERKDFARGVA